MNPWVSVTSKKEFLSHLVHHYRFRNPDAKRILDYLLSHPHLLDHVHFTEVIHPNERNLEISTTCVNTVPFKYYRPSSSTFNVAEAFSDIQANPKRKLYLLLHFRGKHLNFKYLELVKGPTHEAQEAIQIKKTSELIVKRSLVLRKITELHAEIDQALTQLDKAAFLQLTERKKNLESELHTLNNLLENTKESTDH